MLSRELGHRPKCGRHPIPLSGQSGLKQLYQFAKLVGLADKSHQLVRLETTEKGQPLLPVAFLTLLMVAPKSGIFGALSIDSALRGNSTQKRVP